MMKKISAVSHLKLTMIALFVAISFESSFGQNFPFGFNYQAVVRDANGSAKATTTVGVRISIVSTSSAGPTIFQEVHTTTTNALGQFNITVGSGINTFTPGGLTSFSLIPWNSNIYFIRSEVQMGASPSFTQIGTVQQLMAVPYALNARSFPPSIKTFTSAGTGTYTTPPGISHLEIKMIGGGGGGGNGVTSFPGGGGGSGGGMEFIITNPSPTYTYAVGAGGAPTVNGGPTAFGPNICSGGAGAPIGTATNLTIAGGSGTINIGSGIVFDGGRGGAGGSGFTLQGGQGGNGIFGGGGGSGSSTNGGVGGTGGAAASNTGGGGGGGGGGTAGGSTGGAGGSGVIIVKEYYK
jgi:hypothetical protein